MRRAATCYLLVLAAVLAACAPDLTKQSAAAAGPIALFDLERQQKLPWPNVVAQVSAGAGGKPVVGPLNLPNPAGDPLVALFNTQKGFTALPVISFDFSAPISPATIKPGTNLLVLGVNVADPADADDVSTHLTFTFDPAERRLRLYPQRPLRSGFQYAVVLTRGIQDAAGRPIGQDQSFFFVSAAEPLVDAAGRVRSDILTANGVTAGAAAELEHVRRLYDAMVFTHPLVHARVAAELAAARRVTPGALSAADVRGRIAVATAFVTAPYAGGDPTAGLDAAVREAAASNQTGQFFTGVTYPAAAFFALKAPTIPHTHIGTVAFGVITSLDFRTPAGTWPEAVSGAGAPVTVTVIATYPRTITAAPAPVVILQHALGSCKNESVLAAADSFAQAGFAVVGIDAVEYGDRARTNADPSNDADAPGLCDQVSGGKLVASGEGFVRIDDLRITRDAVRQTVVDMAALAKAVQAGAFKAVRPGGDFAPGSATFVGASLGGILGTAFLAEQTGVNVGVLNVPGAWLSRLFLESKAFGPVLTQAIAARAHAGEASSETFQNYLTKLVPLIQGLVDPADPAYYAAAGINGKPLTGDKAVLVQEVLGDPVVPNAATEYLTTVAGIPLVTVDTPAEGRSGAFPFSAWTQFPGGSHGVLLTPDDPATAGPDADLLAVTTAMRTQLLTFLGSYLQSGGQSLNVLVTK
jgi:hypothetical protein